MKSRRRLIAAFATVASLGLAAACGDGGSSGDEGSEGLDKVVVAVSSKTMPFAPVIVGDMLGGFRDEGIEIEYQVIGPSDSIPLLATGQIDVVLTAPSAGIFNAIASGADVRMVAPFSPSPEENSGSGNGLWVKDSMTGGSYEPSDLTGATIGSSAGDGSLISVLVYDELQKADMDLSDVKFQTLGVSDILVGLQSGAITAGWLSDPTWVAAQADKELDAELVLGWPASVPQGGVIYGPSLLDDRPEVGKAFLKGYYSAVADHLSGEYYDDAEVMDVLAEANEVPVETLKQVPAPNFESLLSGQFSPVLSPDKLQSVYSSKPGILQYDKPLSEADVYDLTASEEVLGELGMGGAETAQ